jgi:acyl-CoA reductase-like NAD-dependent aldehyde dehydrogenase
MRRVDLHSDDVLEPLPVDQPVEDQVSREVAVIGEEAARKAKIAAKIAAETAAAEQRQRDLDAALADAVEIVRRQRDRLGRRVCSRPDGGVIRQIFKLLENMQAEVTADNDPSFL